MYPNETQRQWLYYQRLHHLIMAITLSLLVQCRQVLATEDPQQDHQSFCVIHPDGTTTCLSEENSEGSIPIEWGEDQFVSGKEWRETIRNIQITKEYMKGVFQNETLVEVQSECRSRNKLCAFWAAIGKQSKNIDACRSSESTTLCAFVFF